MDQQISELNKTTALIADHCASYHGLEISDEAIGALQNIVLTELTEIFIPDVVAFAKHAKRTSVRPPDILLFTRKSEALSKSVSDVLPPSKAKKEKPAKKGE